MAMARTSNHPPTTAMRVQQHHPTRPPEQGWLLITALAATATVGIAAFALSVAWIRHHRTAGRTLERQELATIARALQAHVIESAEIPHPSNLPTVLAARLARPVTAVLTNRLGNPRLLLADPDLALGPSGTNGLPYVQGSAGSRPPINPRLLLLSSVGSPLPASLSNGATLSSAQFSNLWNTAPAAIPSDWSWPGEPADLCIERIPLDDLFVTVVLRYHADAPPHRGRYLVSHAPGTNGHALLPSTPFTNAFLRGSQLTLLGIDGTLQFRDVLQESGRKYTCQNGVWRLGEGSSGSRLGPVIRHPTPEEFADALLAFMDPEVSLWPNNGGASKQQMFQAITNFLALGAYENYGGDMLTAQNALIDAWVDFTGAQPNKP